MKKILIAVVVVAAAFGIYSNSQKENALSGIMMENIEALAEEEAISIPCEAGNGTCEFTIQDANGNTYSAWTENMVKVS